MESFRIAEKDPTIARKRVYPPEFRSNVIELVRSAKSVSAVAKEYDVARLTVTNWLKQDDLDAGRRSDGLTSAENAEVAKLRKRVRELEIERDILKEPQRGLLARPIRCPESLRIRESTPRIWPVPTQCRVLNVSVSGCYAWLKRPSCDHAHDIAIGDALKVYFERSRRTCGWPRLADDIRDAGIHTSGK